MSAGGKPPPVSPKISNPYAKKKDEIQPRPAAASIAPAARALHIVELGNATTASFSQAFCSVEDTVHYRNEDSESNTEERQQRIFDSTTTAHTTTTTTSTTTEDVRKQHVLLQQPHVLYVSTKQRGNGVLNFIRNVPFQYSTMIPDFILSSQRCALFLSLKYHTLYPNYIHKRISELKTDFTLRILLVLVDMDDNATALLVLNKLAVVQNMTLILSWTEEEAARYLETYKALEGKDASMIQKKEPTSFVEHMAYVLGTIKSVNKTDAAQLLSQFGSLKAVTAATVDELVLCPGVGEKKVKRIYDAFHMPFSKKRVIERKEVVESGNANMDVVL